LGKHLAKKWCSSVELPLERREIDAGSAWAKDEDWDDLFCARFSSSLLKLIGQQKRLSLVCLFSSYSFLARPPTGQECSSNIGHLPLFVALKFLRQFTPIGGSQSAGLAGSWAEMVLLLLLSPNPRGFQLGSARPSSRAQTATRQR